MLSELEECRREDQPHRQSGDDKKAINDNNISDRDDGESEERALSRLWTLCRNGYVILHYSE